MKNIIKKLSKKEIIILLISIIFIFFEVYLDLKVPDHMSNITKLVQTSKSSINPILKEGGIMLLCAFGSMFATIIVGYLSAYISASFSRRIRKELFRKVEDFGMAEIKKFSTSSLITRTTNDVTNVERFIAIGIQMLFRSPITAIWAINKIINKNLEWSVLTGGALVILMMYIVIIMLVVLPKFKKVQLQIDKINDVSRENLTGLRVVRAFNAEKYQEEKFEEANNELTNTQVFNQTVMSTLNPVMNLVMHGLSLGIYFVGAYLISTAGMLDKIDLFSNMVVFSSYSMSVLSSFLMLAMIFIFYPRAAVSAKRINEVLQTPITILDGKITKGTESGTIEFKNVSFKYPDGKDNVLENITFDVKQGETVAFIGRTGSGKTTLVNLIPRLFDTTEGEVLVNGINVKEYSLKSLHNFIGYVPQKVRLFKGTIKDNITYGETDHEITEEDIKESIRVSQSEEFVSKYDDKYNHEVALDGSNLSGGQKQRLSIARAIARKPKIYIFDDTFSALDYKTDSKLRSELKEYTKDATILIVAQRIGTIMSADKIIVLDEGKIVGVGKHKDLMKKCKLYKEIALSQLSEEELANE